MQENSNSVTYTEKIYTKNGITQVNVFGDKKVLHIGSGKSRLAGTTTMDMLNLPGVDIVHDLDQMPWPIQDNEYDVIFAHSVFEHLEDQVKIMEEMWRILKPKGRIVICVPHFRCVDAFNDSTHTHFFTAHSMDYYIQGTRLADYEYTNRYYNKIGFWIGWPQPSNNPVMRWFKSFVHAHQNFYDSHLSLLFPVKILIWELEVIKN